MQPILNDFAFYRPRHTVAQSEALAWLQAAHARSEAQQKGLDEIATAAFSHRLSRLLARCACAPAKIAARASTLPDFLNAPGAEDSIYAAKHGPHGADMQTRARHFASVVDDYFRAQYAATDSPPAELIHVTCTGYVAPSGAQKLVAEKGWGDRTRVTHAYHMGCYAAMPALRMARGALQLDRKTDRIDIVHTELCTLHLDPSDHSPEQLVVQSLFGDGFIRYSMRAAAATGLRVLAVDERIIPDSAALMTWNTTAHGMSMTLSRQVPARIGAALRSFVTELYARGGLSLADLPRSQFAIHPGGPKIIDSVQQLLELTDAQCATSRGVLHDYGNMSSATLPHVWMRMLADPAIASGTPIMSLAFGPGLTICGALLRKQ